VRIFFAVPRSAWVDLNLRRSLEDMGHELVRFDFPGWPDDADPAWQYSGKPDTNQRLLEHFRTAVRKRPVDLFFGYFYSSVVYPETIDVIRQSGVPTVNFSCNNVHQFDLVRDIAPRFDVCVVPERSALADFHAVGARPLRIQLAANPRVYRPYPEPRIYDVTFVGQRYADRADFLGHLFRHGVDVHAWGAGWQPHKRLDLAHARAALALIEDERLDGIRRLLNTRLAGRGSRPSPRGANSSITEKVFANGAVQGEVAPREVDTSAFGGPRLLQLDLIKMFSQSRMSLGFATAGESHLADKRLTHLRLREFEAPMSGALYLTEDQPELAEYFEPGTELLTYTNQDDLLDKARYYLSHQEQSERIRHAGVNRARADHTWQHRFRELFAALGLKERP
jgi:spore maturation protein CgeB